MEMIWHHDEFVQKVRSSFAASKDTLNKQLCGLRHSEKLAPLPRGG